MTAPRTGRREALTRLRSAQKSNRGAAGYSRWVNRPFGRQIAAVAYPVGLSPNQISTISALFTAAGIAGIAVLHPTWWTSLVVTGLLLIGYACDSADGQVARLRGGGSAAGEWLDHVLDAVKVSAIHLAVGIAWFRFYGLHNHAGLLIPLAFAVVAATFFFAITLSDMLRRIHNLKAGGAGVATASVDPTEAAPVLRSIIVLPNDYGVLCLSFVLLATHPAFITVYTVLLVANVLFLLAGCVRWFREMSQY